MEQKIRQLCAQFLAAEDSLELQAVAGELQQAIHQHVADILENAHARALAQILPADTTLKELPANSPDSIPTDTAKGPQL